MPSRDLSKLVENDLDDDGQLKLAESLHYSPELRRKVMAKLSDKAAEHLIEADEVQRSQRRQATEAGDAPIRDLRASARNSSSPEVSMTNRSPTD
ncbi:MAG: hypothetical protein HYV63_08845 [Candidatus Schekmanbacteria bacterium]|nr:hypothetical protein [Candidatus Schekmanbacteria bacterium]